MTHPHKSTTTPERFYHVRQNFLYNGKQMQGGTVFWRQEGRGAGEKYWTASVSRCSAKDVWNKKVGRTIARRRYFNAAQNDGRYLGSETQHIFGPLPEGLSPNYEISARILLGD